jgi:hypothetical protein
VDEWFTAIHEASGSKDVATVNLLNDLTQVC